ncbi:MAG: hypothetical protein JWL59_5181 [Chthoniobacteraceae bacterium]|nr:hypothetical protein [Chthoniobacteraceae bacterium]
MPFIPDSLCLRTHRFAGLLASFAIFSLAQAGTGLAAPPGAHAWQSIEYPRLPVPGLETENLSVLVGSGGGDEASHLRFDVLWSGGRDEALPVVIADADKFVVRLHLSDGKVILPQPEKRPQSWMGAGSRGMTYSLIYLFPWQRNEMEEAWIEFALPRQTYWIELPYGFTRDPADALPADSKRGEPVFPPTMKTPGEDGKMVPWLRVNYNLGQIQNGWRLSLKIANPFDAKAEVILYRDDSRVGQSMFLWKLDTPRTAMEIKTGNGSIIAAHAMGIRLHEDGMRRSDNYSFNRYPEGGRDWGKVVIRVDEKACEGVVPSSLFKYVHGATRTGTFKQLSRPKEGQ